MNDHIHLQNEESILFDDILLLIFQNLQLTNFYSSKMNLEFPKFGRMK